MAGGLVEAYITGGAALLSTREGDRLDDKVRRSLFADLASKEKSIGNTRPITSGYIKDFAALTAGRQFLKADDPAALEKDPRPEKDEVAARRAWQREQELKFKLDNRQQLVQLVA